MSEFQFTREVAQEIIEAFGEKSFLARNNTPEEILADWQEFQEFQIECQDPSVDGPSNHCVGNFLRMVMSHEEDAVRHRLHDFDEDHLEQVEKRMSSFMEKHQLSTWMGEPISLRSKKLG